MRWVALGLAGLLAATLPGQMRSETLSFSVGQARILARDAYLGGDMTLAYSVAHRLLERDAHDPAALMIVAATAPKVGQPAEGRRAGQQAFRLMPTPALRYEAARFTAQAAFVENRLGIAQYWLRRAADIAPTPAQRARSVNDFRLVRARNPWRFGVDLSLSPSDNLNNGAETALLDIPGLPPGQLSGSALALSGTRLTAGVNLRYQFAPRDRSRTEFGARMLGTFNWLSADAKRQVMTPQGPELVGSDLNYALAEALLTHRFQLRPLPKPIALTFSAGQSWYGGDAYAHLFRIGASTGFDVSQHSGLRITASAERQYQLHGSVSETLTFGTQYIRETAKGHQISLGVSLFQVLSERSNDQYVGIGGQITYALAKAIGPVRLSGHVSASLRDYPTYRIGIFPVAGGRQDERLGLGADVEIDRIELMGFSPVVSFEASKTSSNISRYNTSDLSLSLGVHSAF